MWVQQEIEETQFELAGLIWHVKPRPFWETSRFLIEREDDQVLSRVAVALRGFSGGGKRYELSPEQARASISRFTAPQLIELNNKFSSALSIHKTPISFSIPAPLPTPHWKRELSPADRIAPENRDMINKAMAQAKAELEDDSLSSQRTEANLAVVLKGLKKEEEEEDPSDDPDNKMAEDDLYPRQEQSDQPEEAPAPKPVRKFVLSDIVTQLYAMISQNILLFPGKWGDNTLTLRYVGRRELLALRTLYPDTLDRERRHCAMAIASLNDDWCLSSIKINPLALEFVDNLTDFEVETLFGILQKIRDYAGSFIPYIEATPFTKVLNDFWVSNKSRTKWWSEDLSGIPNISNIPPLEHIDLFMHECLVEDAEQERLSGDDTLSMQLAGMSHELAQAIQNKTKEAHSLRSQHIHFMLYNEIPKAIQEDPNKINIPAESSQEDLVAHIEDMHKGRMDYHDLMLSLMRKRKESLAKLHPSNAPEPSLPPASKDEAYGGGTHFATAKEVQDLQRAAREQRAAMDKEIYEFSTDAVSNIAKRRRRSLMIDGKDPYHDQDESVDMGRASRIIRTKNF